jgi:hypothetical protein
MSDTQDNPITELLELIREMNDKVEILNRLREEQDDND